VSDGEPGYPLHWEADVVLRDGSTAHLRPIRPDDDERLRAFHDSLSAQTVYFRFFAPYPALTQRDVERFTQVDHHDRVALVATVHDEIVGVTRYDRQAGRPGDAEVAFTVRDTFQGRGLGSVLLEHLASAARERGVHRFVAEVLPDNARMLAVFREAGYAPATSLDDGYYTLEFEIAPTPDSLAVMETREHRAEARSVEQLLAPSSVAVLGAGHRASSAGRVVLRHLDAAGFTGPVYVVNPRAAAAGETIAGHVAHARVADIGEPVDMAVVAVPAADVLATVADCAAAGVRGLVVVSAGFAESGPQGRVLQADLVAAAHAHGMRVLGPNCLGVINTDPALRLNASLSPVVPGRGRIGFFSQSGALGVALLQRVAAHGLGLSTFVSAGNRADVSGNDLIQYWEDDRSTDVLLLYLESIGNPRKFTRIARRTSLAKPIVAVKSGRSSQGIPLGHAVRRSGLPPAAVDAMFAQSGVIQVDTLSELFDVAELLSFQPLPAGRRVAVIGNSDALAVLAEDACADRGLEVVGEPRTVAPGTDAATFGQLLAAILDDPAVDAVLALFLPSVGSASRSITREVARVAARSSKPVLATVLAVEGAHALLERAGVDGTSMLGSVPAYGAVEDAVRALACVCAYVEWRQSPHDPPPELEGVDAAAGRALVESALERSAGGGPLSAAELTELLACYGIRLWPAVRAATADEAVEAAARLGFPVVIKTTVPSLEHRGDLGAVRLDLSDEGAVRRAFAAIADDFGAQVASTLLVQRMAGTGVPCVVSTAEDLLFGPVVSFGIGGIVTELVGDRAYRIPPLARHDAAALVHGPKAAPLLFGHRGAPPADTAALEDLLLRVGRLAHDLPEVAALELNPVLAQASGVAVLAASAVCAPPARRRDGPARRLS
jgi:acyl-CoA synthetase (NDP forming)/GNAT superfamily N-acetyltransferase